MENETVQAEGVAVKKMSTHSIKMIGSIVVVILVIVLGIFLGKRATPKRVEELSTARLMQSISHLIVVPNEAPIIATINQPDVLTKEQPFYNGSQAGDKLVIFPQAQKAIIYSPARNVIVNSGPFVVNSGTNTQTQTQAPAPTTTTPAAKK